MAKSPEQPELERKIGRPSEYSAETADAICERLIEGESLRAICASEGMPAASTVCRWLANNEAFRKQYAHAREAQADTLADESLDIADDGSNDWMERHNDEGENTGWQVNGEHIQRSRLRIETRKWLASKLKPKKYGEKVEHQHAGAGRGPIVHRIELVDLASESASSATPEA